MYIKCRYNNNGTKVRFPGCSGVCLSDVEPENFENNTPKGMERHRKQYE